MPDPELTRKKPLTLRVGVNHETKVLEVIVTGASGVEAEGSLTVDEINRLMASLSQCQYALVLSADGGEQLMAPFDPARPFETQGGYVLAKRDAVARHQVAVDDIEGTVGLLALGSSGRLTGYRMSPERACQIADGLQAAAAQIRAQSKRSFDA